MPPFYNYSAINALSNGDTGHFIFLDSWSISLLGSMLSQGMPLHFWMNDQYPLSQSEIDDLENKLATAGGQLMQSMVGLIMPICSQSIPTGMLLCDGSTYLRVDYPNLYDALDLFYIIDDYSFRVPDMSDRFVLGAGNVIGRNDTGGSFGHTQTIGEMPTHTHTSPPHAHSEVASVPTIINGGLEAPASAATPTAATTGFTAATIDAAGGGQEMDVTNPYIALRYVVVAL